jgi:hypothetical protein
MRKRHPDIAAVAGQTGEQIAGVAASIRAVIATSEPAATRQLEEGLADLEGCRDQLLARLDGYITWGLASAGARGGRVADVPMARLSEIVERVEEIRGCLPDADPSAEDLAAASAVAVRPLRRRALGRVAP